MLAWSCLDDTHEAVTWFLTKVRCSPRLVSFSVRFVVLNDKVKVIHSLLLPVEKQVHKMAVPVGVYHGWFELDGASEVGEGRFDSTELAQNRASSTEVVRTRVFGGFDCLCDNLNLLVQQLQQQQQQQQHVQQYNM